MSPIVNTPMTSVLDENMKREQIQRCDGMPEYEAIEKPLYEIVNGTHRTPSRFFEFDKFSYCKFDSSLTDLCQVSATETFSYFSHVDQIDFLSINYANNQIRNNIQQKQTKSPIGELTNASVECAQLL